MHQSWLRLTMLHWRYPPQAVQRLLPPSLAVDTFDGSAWVGLIPFLMQGIRPPGLPALPWLSTFPETNVRTYVRGPDDRPGVYFLSLDISRLAPVLVARATYRLPYMWARMGVDLDAGRLHYWGRRRWPGPAGAGSRVGVTLGEPIHPSELGPLHHFLTARWGLYAARRYGVAWAPVAHPPWPLQRATLDALEEDLVAAAGLTPPTGPPLVHYSPGVTVRIGAPRRLPH